MSCKLCLEERPLRNSHVLPELLFRRAYDSLHRAREFTIEPHRQRHIQQGYREALLYTECEGHISCYEKYFADVWFNRPLRPGSVSVPVVTVTGLNYRFFKLFHLSVLWRAGVSERAEFREVRLGPHEERLRGMLIADDPGPPHAYPFWGQFLVDPRDGEVLEDVILEPGCSRPSGHTVYTFVFGGCAWYYFASSHTGDRPLPTIFGPAGELVVHATSIFNFEPLVQSFVMFKALERRAPRRPDAGRGRQLDLTRANRDSEPFLFDRRTHESPMPDDLLFHPNDLRSALQAKVHAMLEAIEKYDGNRLLNSDEDQLTAYFVAAGSVEPISLRESEISAAQSEDHYDVRHRFDYAVFDKSRPQLVPATRITLHVPFDGEADLFQFTPATRTFNPPRGTVEGDELLLTYVAPSAEAGGAKKDLDEELRKVREYIGWVNNDVKQHNASLEAPARQAIQARKRRLLDNQNVVASLGYAIRPRPDAARTYSVPTVRRKVSPSPPPASSAPFVPEPALSDAIYEQILQVLGNMVRVMEQSPEAFADMEEEDLRTHFLVQLNGQFEGQASAETFRGSGSTDILLVERDRSVFIAECKFWDGPASVIAALDQLLDYATWRDAKAALILFSRNKDFSAVVAAVPGAIAGHPQHSGEVKRLGETVFRSRLKQRDDESRLLTVTTLAYNVPTNRSRSTRLKPRRRKPPRSD